MKLSKRFLTCLLAMALAALLLLTACSSASVTITAKANNTSYGTVSGSGSYTVSNSVTVKATPNTGYRFTGWQKDGKTISTNASYTFTASETCTLTAVFVKNPVVTVKADAAAGGTVTGGGSYAPGSSVTVTATQNTGYVFRGWVKDGTTVSTDTSYTFTVTADCTLTASFTKFTYADSKAYAVNQKMKSGYTVDANASYEGIEMKLYVTSNGSKIYEQATALNKTVTALIDGTKIYLLNSTKKTYTITTEAPLNFDINTLISGKITSIEQGETTVNSTKYYCETLVMKDGNTASYCFDSSDNLKYLILTLDGEKVTIKFNSLLFTYDASKLTLDSYKSENTVTVTLEASPSEGGTVTGGGDYEFGTSVTVKATANSGYSFGSWLKNGEVVSTTASYTFEAEECTLTAVFEAIPSDEIPIDEEHFPDATFRTYVSTNFDKDSSGGLSKSEIAAVTVIDVSRKSITSLKGIEYFTNLQKLYCYNNNLTSLDVSKNTKLTYLFCVGNKLTSLDVSKNTAKNTTLLWLYCDGNVTVIGTNKNVLIMK